MTPNQLDPTAREIDGFRRVAVVVAHPDDEILWAGGLLLAHPEWRPFVVSLCRGDDPDRAPRFFKALGLLNAQGAMGEAEDGPDQIPLADASVRDLILSLLPRGDYDLLLTHGPNGEYTRHRRHEEVSRAVMGMWREREIRSRWLWQFAYEDGGRSYSPRPRRDANLRFPLADHLLKRKSSMITGVYGFNPASWEAGAVTAVEAFDCFREKLSVPQTPTANPPPNP